MTLPGRSALLNVRTMRSFARDRTLCVVPFTFGGTHSG